VRLQNANWFAFKKIVSFFFLDGRVRRSKFASVVPAPLWPFVTTSNPLATVKRAEKRLGYSSRHDKELIRPTAPLPSNIHHTAVSLQRIGAPQYAARDHRAPPQVIWPHFDNQVKAPCRLLPPISAALLGLMSFYHPQAACPLLELACESAVGTSAIVFAIVGFATAVPFNNREWHYRREKCADVCSTGRRSIIIVVLGHNGKCPYVSASPTPNKVALESIRNITPR